MARFKSANPVLQPISRNLNSEHYLELLNQRLCPLISLPYPKQLLTKKDAIAKLLKKFGEKLFPFRKPLIQSNCELPCVLEDVHASPKIYQYRNKDEFTIWPGVDGNRKTLGFFLQEPSKYKDAFVVEPDRLVITKESHKNLAKKFQTYLREISPYDVCTDFKRGGNWRRFVVRSNEKGEHMVIAIMHPMFLTKDELDQEKLRLIDYFFPLSKDLAIKSAYFQACPGVRCSNEKAPFELLFGEKVIKEHLFKKVFQISPESFFQVNSKAAKILYQVIIDELEPNKNVTVIDLCCGTGTTSLLISPKVKKVIGIDLSSQAIEDAKQNALLNNITNCQFFSGYVENYLPGLREQLYSEHVVVVANPNRGGFRNSVVTLLREMDCIKKLVFVSCKPEGDALRNFVHLSLPFRPRDEILGQPYLPVKAIPIDLFPHTTHCELVFSFTRD